MSKMNANLSQADLERADVLLSELFKEVQNWEGMLASGTELGAGASAIENLRQSQVGFGNPRDNLVLLTEETFRDNGIELNSTYKEQMQSQYDFYSMTLTVSLRPKPIVQFWRLTCELNFAPKGKQETIIQAIFPTEKWRSVMNFGIGMDIGVNGNLDWSAGVDASELTQIIELLPNELKANASTKNEIKTFTAIPAYKYELGYSEIFTSGVGESICYWRIQDRELQKVGTVKLAVVFKVPKGAESINLRGLAAAEPNVNWLTSDIRDVFSELSDQFKNLLRNKEEAAKQLARGDAKEWVLLLPKPA
jgi:hypothetical protein